MEHQKRACMLCLRICPLQFHCSGLLRRLVPHSQFYYSMHVGMNWANMWKGLQWDAMVVTSWKTCCFQPFFEKRLLIWSWISYLKETMLFPSLQMEWEGHLWQVGWQRKGEVGIFGQSEELISAFEFTSQVKRMLGRRESRTSLLRLGRFPSVPMADESTTTKK